MTLDQFFRHEFNYSRKVLQHRRQWQNRCSPYFNYSSQIRKVLIRFVCETGPRKGATTFSITTLNINGSYVTFGITTLSMTTLPVCWMSNFIYCYAVCHYVECRYAKCHYAECRYDECRSAKGTPSQNTNSFIKWIKFLPTNARQEKTNRTCRVSSAALLSNRILNHGWLSRYLPTLMKNLTKVRKKQGTLAEGDDSVWLTDSLS